MGQDFGVSFFCLFMFLFCWVFFGGVGVGLVCQDELELSSRRMADGVQKWI